MTLEQMPFFQNINTIQISYPSKDSVYFYRAAGFPKKIKKATFIEYNEKFWIMFENRYTNVIYWEGDKFMIIDCYDRLNEHWNKII